MIPSPTLHQLYIQSIVLCGCLQSPREFWLIFFFNNLVYFKVPAQYSSLMTGKLKPSTKVVCLKQRLSKSLQAYIPQFPFCTHWIGLDYLQGLCRLWPPHGSLCFWGTRRGNTDTVLSFHLAMQPFFLLSLKYAPLWVLVKIFPPDAKQPFKQEILPVCSVCICTSVLVRL